MVAIAFVALAAVIVAWTAIDRRPPEWDHANHLERAVQCARDFSAGDWRAIVERSSFYPPLVTCTAALARRLAPSEAVAAESVMVLFLGLGMAGTWALGRRLAGGPAGVVAALVFGAAPFVVFSALRFQLDLPLAAMVALALWTLLETEGFTHRGWSLATGLVLGLGMLTKPPFAAYLLPALVVVAVRVRGGRRLLNLGLALLLGAALSLPWYGPRLMGIPAQIATRSFRQAAESGHPDPLTWTGLLFYPTWFPVQFGLGATMLALAGLVIAVRRRQWVALAVLLVPFVLFESLQNKNLRYTLPLLPVAAVLAGLAFAGLRGRARIVVGVLGAALVVVQVSGTAFGVPPRARLPVVGLELAMDSPPSAAVWPHRAILELISRDSGGAGATVSVVPNAGLFSTSNFRYYGTVEGLPLRVTRAWDDEPLGVDYMILKTGNVGPSWTAEKPRRIEARLRDDPHLARVFPVLGTWPLPDGSVATVRVRRVPRALDATPAAVARAIEAAFRRRLGEVARDVERLDVRLTYDRGILGGQLRRVEITAAAATVGELRRREAALLRLHDVRLLLEDVLVNPFSAYLAGELHPLDVGLLRLERASIGARDFQAFLGGLRGFRRASVALADGGLAFAFAQPGPDIAGRVRVIAARDRPFALVAEGVRVGGLPVPRALMDWVIRQYDPSGRIASRSPFRVDVAPISVTPEAIRIGGR